MRLKDKVAVVTGSASGFGEGIAKRFAEEGAHVLLGDINKEGVEKVVSEIRDQGGNAISFQVDVSNSLQVKEMLDSVTETYGKL